MNRAKQLAQRRALLVTECALQRLTLQSSRLSIGRSAMFSAALDVVVACIPVKLISLAKVALDLWKIWRTYKR